MANKKEYAAPNAAVEELVKVDVLFGSGYDNIGTDENWSEYLNKGGSL